MNVKLAFGTALLLPVAIALSGCGRDEANTTVTVPSVDVPPAVEKRAEQTGAAVERGAEQAGAVMDDASITAKVKTALIADPELSGLAIDVDTSANVVTLNGSVASDAARANAERIAKGVEGVKEVKNNLQVKAS